MKQAWCHTFVTALQHTDIIGGKRFHSMASQNSLFNLDKDIQEATYLSSKGILSFKPLGIDAQVDARNGYTLEVYEKTDALTRLRFSHDAPPFQDPEHPNHGVRELDWAYMMDQDVLMEAAQQRRILWMQQEHTAHNFEFLMATKDFEKEWLNAGVERRRNSFLDAYSRVESAPSTGSVTSHGREKVNCPKLTLDALEAGSGLGFLNLMKSFVYRIRTPTMRPVILENARFDEIVGWRADESNLQKMGWMEIRKLN